MIELEIQFKGKALAGVLGAFQNVPLSMRPVQFGANEGHVDGAVDSAEFPEFVERAKSGFFLIAPDVYYDVSIFPTKGRIICRGWISKDAVPVETFLLDMTSAEPTFGFACATDERDHRNCVKVQARDGDLSAWVGRDPNNTFPGLYWLTLFSPELLERYNFPMQTFRSAATDSVRTESGYWLIKFFERPESWLQHDQMMRSLISGTPGIFDIEAVKQGLPKTDRVLELSSYLSRWK